MEDPRAVLRRYGLAPRRSLGQNFLVDATAPQRIVDHADIQPTDTVLEIGAGLGTLTAPLAARAARVLAVETDPALVAVLNDTFAASPRVEVIAGDILALDPAVLLQSELPPSPLPLWGARLDTYRVVANLPYYITAAVLRHVLEARVRPVRLVVTVQREVAQRMVAQPGDMSLLSVSIQFYGQPRLVMRLKPGAFFPPPAVTSAVVCLDLYAEPPVAVPSVEFFFEVVRAGFAQRRKQLHNTLASTLQLDSGAVSEALHSVGLDARRRAQTLSLPEWGTVVAALHPLCHP